MLPTLLMAASASVILALGLAHLWFTFVGTKLHPRSPECRIAMEASHPVLTRETSIWRAWVGFNASHSFGAMLFGLLYFYLAMSHPGVLFGSPFLLVVGAALLAGYVVLGKLYWFSTPFFGIVVGSALYAASVLVSVLARGA